MKTKHLFIISLTIFLVSCRVDTVKVPTLEVVEIENAQSESAQPINSTPTASPILQTMPPILPEMPYLLFKVPTSKTNPLMLLELSTLTLFPFNLPEGTGINNLKDSISPDKSKLILRMTIRDETENEALLIYDLIENRTIIQLPITHTTTPIFLEMFKDQPITFQEQMQNQNLGYWNLEEGYLNSLGKFWWSPDSKTLYLTAQGDDGYTNLLQYDLIKGETIQLESEPFFIVSLQQLPYQDQLLVTKSPDPLLPNPPFKSIYLIDTQLNSNKIALPSSAPEISWQFESINAAELLVTSYDTARFAYRSIYLYDISTAAWELITDSPFTNYTYSNGVIHLLRNGDPQNPETIINHMLPKGEVPSTSIDENCSNIIVSPLECCPLIIFCQQRLLGLDLASNIIQLSPNQETLSFSPSNQMILTINSSDSTSQKASLNLWDSDFNLIREFNIAPVHQVIWQPDSKGFLFLTLSGLFHVSLPDGEPVLITSGFSDDYRYLDSVWVNQN